MRPDRALPVLAVLCLLEAFFAGSSWFAGRSLLPEESAATILISASLLLLLPAFTVLAEALRGQQQDRRRQAAWVSVLAFIGIEVLFSVGWMSRMNRDSYTTRLAMPVGNLLATLLWGTGAPLLWAAAKVRRDRPDDQRAIVLGRKGAGLAQVSFVLLFAHDLYSYSWRHSYNQTGDSLFTVLHPLLDWVWRICLFWSTVESVRLAPDAETIVRRARRINTLMWIWLAALAAQGAVDASWSVQERKVWFHPEGLGYHAWREAIFLTMLLMIFFATWKALRPQAGRYTPAPETHA